MSDETTLICSPAGMRQLVFIELSLGTIALGVLLLCVVNVVYSQNVVIGALAGSVFGVALVSLWTVERWRRLVKRQREEIETMLGVGRN